jgi:hypothetical protein
MADLEQVVLKLAFLSVGTAANMLVMMECCFFSGAGPLNLRRTLTDG